MHEKTLFPMYFYGGMVYFFSMELRVLSVAYGVSKTIPDNRGKSLIKVEEMYENTLDQEQKEDKISKTSLE